MASPAPVSSFATSRPVAVLMVFVAVVVFGYFSYGRLSVRLMPELSYPTVTVRTEYLGAAPEEVEKDISLPIEEALGVIGGLRRISSVSRADVSDVVLEFAWNTDMSEAVQDALEKLDLVILPQDVGPSLILRFDPSLDPVIELSLSSARVVDEADGEVEGEAELRRLRRIGEIQLKRALEPIKGIAAVRVRGGLEEEIHVLIDSDKLNRVGLSVGSVIQRLQEENINVAGGTIKEGRADYMVRTINEYESLDEIAATVLTDIDGRQVRIRDVGQVVRSHRERDMITRTNGSEGVQIDIFKEADANLVDLARRVRLAIGAIERDRGGRRAPGGQRAEGLAQQLYDDEGAALTVVADRSVFIESSINEVRNTAIIGGLLAVLILFLFLENLKSTLIIGVSIPISLLVTFAPMNLFGVSLNIMSLGGLALGIGMLVDSSIVVLESIYRNREEGRDVVSATVHGTRDVRGAVVASTLTTIGVFLPMVFVEGVAGQAFGDLGLAVVISLLVSLLVALFFIPMLASRQGMARGERRQLGLSWRLAAWRAFVADWRALGILGKLLLTPYLIIRLLLAGFLEIVAKLALMMVVGPLWLASKFVVPGLVYVMRLLWWAPLKAMGAMLRGASRGYPRVLEWALNRAGVVVAITVGCFVLMYVVATSLDSELLPEVHQGEFTVEVALPVGTPLEDTELLLSPVEAAILADREHIDTIIVTLGYDATNSQRSDEGEHTARFKVLLESSADNAATEQLVADRIRQRLASIPDVDARLVRPVLFSFKTPVEVEVYGDDLVRLRALAERVQLEMSAMSELSDIDSTLRKGAPEVQIVYHRDRLRRYGLNVAAVANRVRDEVRGREATRFNQRDHRIPIVVRLAERHRAGVDDIRSLVVDSEQTGTIHLDAVAEVTLGEGPSEVRRVDGQRVAIVRANLAADASLGAAVAALDRRLQDRVKWPSDMSFRISGQNQEWERSRTSLWLALALSIFLVYVIMAAQFESLLYPLIIMFTIPLAFLGTFLTLDALSINLSIVVFLGMIMLAGIVVNNAIVLVDYINILKRRGADLRSAVTRAGAVRLRPILMTTATTALGLLPMALGLGDGAEIRTPLAITVISGLIVSTALTLLVIPTLYFLADNAKQRVTVWARGEGGAAEEEGE